ncbi:transposase [Sphingobacterium faecale]|uniref:Transposase n=1 Tax=Sphingobacterium faecale TaxID=2803775 RepID=A0ABS1R499_9SPHI|nr:transposase [Sphingobacterium faecale]MBL1409534.1 transposase [Sphingobacterium faecale]
MRYSKQIKERVVRDILDGELLIDEAMTKYGILSPITIKKWLREALDEVGKAV